MEGRAEERAKEQTEEQQGPSRIQLKRLGVQNASPEFIQELSQSIHTRVQEHLKSLGLDGEGGVLKEGELSKEAIRNYHARHREQYRVREESLVAKNGARLLWRHFANGAEVIPQKVEPVISIVKSNTEDNDLFRLTTLLWSVPVSRGYGRRMRFLVRDNSNGKLIGIFALTDPVINIRARDEWIGWSQQDRKDRLVNVMDAYVVGAVPPYSQLLGGKVVASLMTSNEVCQAFAEKYGESKGIISGQKKHAQLALITVTSALGRSSLYNRLRLPGILEFDRIGMTEGWGHFQIPQDLFDDMRRLLILKGNKYGWENRFGRGHNWRMRVVRAALAEVGLDGKLLQHGIKREIFAAPLAADWREFLCGKVSTCTISRPSGAEIGRLAVNRWLIPRAERRAEYKNWTQADTWEQLTAQRNLI